MKRILAILILSAGLAGAELSPEEFNQVRNFALTCGSGFYFAGTDKFGDYWIYKFCDKNGLVFFIDTSVNTFEEARQAMIASLATFIICKHRWKDPLNAFLQRKIPLPPPGFTEFEPGELDPGFTKLE
jgi:hypothetical protein